MIEIENTFIPRLLDAFDTHLFIFVVCLLIPSLAVWVTWNWRVAQRLKMASLIQFLAFLVMLIAFYKRMQ